MCVCVMDPQRHGRPSVIFQQLFPLCSCTAADRTLPITLIVPAAACVTVRRDPLPDAAAQRKHHVKGSAPSITMDTVSAAVAERRRCVKLLAPGK